ncbi:hypoxanthine-guanine phosphoribosyltransferase [Parasulfuritortus cantonensis]|uniref:Hypoxanthine-guanine phosphoribosyltransferase n=1 Tax=Parasulfuritortus cantonensis TaxID=2528202 RepID=A0A4R1BKM8_9PROT|nr:hypoxanthine-guanine phosphoribosyltransferase [Parasulfuritortus cantonensis]TCJ17950.1 hypoxanthine-guanine phosphoribosyltransferase [Parasulfuritortus cantonensis]
MTEIDKAWTMFRSAELVYDQAAIEQALDRLGAQISARLADSFPVALCVMGGAVVFAGQLLPRLAFPLQFDYLHATRYRDGTRGGEIEWCALPRGEVDGRVVLLMDDILDEGYTLAAVKAKLLELGAARVEVAVLAEKELGRAKPIEADYVGLMLPDRYVFGMGMDAYGLWRNLPAIYALKED